MRGYFASHIVEDCELWVAEQDGALAGILVLDGDFVDQLYVEPRLTGRGIGSALLRSPSASARRACGCGPSSRTRAPSASTSATASSRSRRTDGRDNEERAPDVLYAYRAS